MLNSSTQAEHFQRKAAAGFLKTFCSYNHGSNQENCDVL